MCSFFSWILFCIVPAGTEMRRNILITDGKELRPIPSRDVGTILKLLQRLKREEG
jgi:hypothetical protein